MRCDKCKKVCDDNWTPGFGYPKFDIKERESVMSSVPINLCLKCSQDLKKWLHGNDEQENN